MNAPAGWQKGSWRGLPFVTMDQEQEGGRRLVQHELPQGEKPVLEDLGARAERYTLTCEIRGADYIAAAKAFGEALRAPGPGTLVHPWLGSMQVGVDTFSRTDSTEDGGFAGFSIVFLESGLPLAAQPAADTPALARAAADDAALVAPDHFIGAPGSSLPGFSIEGAQGFVEDAAAELVNKAAGAMAIVSGLQGGVGPALRALIGDNGILPANVQAMLREPAELGLAIVGALQSIAAIGGTALALIDGLTGLVGFGDDLPTINGGTPARDRQRINQAAIVQLVNLTAASELARVLSETDFDSYDEAVDLRDRAADALDRVELRQGDAGDDAGSGAIATLRRAIVRDVTARGGSLARLQTYTPIATEPATVIAYRLYGPRDLEANAAELVGRNRVRHPGFVPGGVALQVRTPAQAVAHG